MLEICMSGSEGGGDELNRLSLPLSWCRRYSASATVTYKRFVNCLGFAPYEAFNSILNARKWAEI